MITLDFETKPIEEHKILPEPVGLAIRWGSGATQYLSWGHRTDNTCTREEAVLFLQTILESNEELLFHNAKFDLGVMIQHLAPAAKNLPWRRLHDTQFLLVLNEPYAKNLQLKSCAERLLGMKPEERDAILEWLLLHELDACKIQAKKVGKSVKDAAKGLVWLAPVHLVAEYAIGDVVRTYELFRYLHPRILREEMDRAYDLERRVLMPLTKLELRGLRVNKKGLEDAMVALKASQQEAALRIFDKLGQYTDIGSPSLARVLHRGRHVEGLGITPTGRVSTSKESLEGARFQDRELRELVLYWRSCAYVLNNSIEPWLLSAGSGDIIRTSFHQTRGGDGGARTLRLSCAWFMNIANERKLRYELLPDLYKIPSPRDFIIPHEGYTKIISRDWKQQEFRVAAHFEDGDLMKAYQANPLMDVHDNTTKVIQPLLGWAQSYEFNKFRKIMKVFNLAVIYGMGVDKAAIQAKVSSDQARSVRDMVKRMFPGLASLSRRLQETEARRGYVRTYMGAKLTKEPPFRMGNGHLIDFAYKLLNHTVQRSAAEQMKDVVAKWDEDGYAEVWPWMISVHDQNDAEATEDNWKAGSVALGQVMAGGTFDVAMLSDLAVGENWGSGLVEMNDDFTLKEI